MPDVLAAAGSTTGLIGLVALLIGIPNLIANRLGAVLFDPAAEGVFRLAAYLVIAASAIIGLPFWKGM